MSSQNQATRSDQTGFSPKEFLFKYLRFLPLFILSVVLSLIVAFFYLRYTSPVFQSKGALILTEDKGAKSGDKFEQLFSDDRSKNINNELEFLKSRALLERVVAELGINTRYYAKGKIKELNIYKDAPFRLEILAQKDSTAPFEFAVHFKDANSFQINGKGRVYKTGQEISHPAGLFRINATGPLSSKDVYSVKWNSPAQMATALRKGLQAYNKAGSSGIIIINLESENPWMSADIVNKLMKEYQEGTIEQKNSKNRQTMDFLNTRLALVNRELDSIERNVLAYRKSNDLSDIQSMTSSYFSRADAADEKITELRAQLNVVKLIQDYLRDNKLTYEIVPSSLGLNDVTLNQQVSLYNNYQMERKTLITEGNVPVGNPRVKLKEDQIEKMRGNILENLSNVRRSYEGQLADVDRRNTALQASIRGLPEKQQVLLGLEREKQSKQAVFAFLSEKKEETAISLAATISNIGVLEKAEVNRVPVSPSSIKIRGIALLIGIIIPLLFVLVLEIMDDKISSRVDIERHTSASILGEVSHAANEETLVVKPRSRSFIAEQFRIIRSNLQYMLTETGRTPVLLVTSSFSGEGKSFISTNMGAVMALAGKRTVILELDLRKPKILQGLNMTKKPGFTNYLLGKASLDDLIVPVEGIDNLFVLPCGPIPPNPAELLLDKRIDEVFHYLRTNFDFVVLDTAPVGMVGDAMTLANYADSCLYIVRQGVTHKKQLEMVNDFYKANQLPRMSLILNDVKLRAGYGYYGYGRYGYGYGNGSYGYGYGYGYYDDDVEGTSFLRRWFGWAMPSKKKKAKKEKAG
ncbi:GumC family protein [Flaviaesturariibacter amylovorans]|uniref:Polysaccharide biosynthesis tyrosine autokinase n=1 Tax=Flaviaesturariibacter amylovorans TaxID=1084520 RepID=A0ABP8GC28_9BACT